MKKFSRWWKRLKIERLSLRGFVVEKSQNHKPSPPPNMQFKFALCLWKKKSYSTTLNSRIWPFRSLTGNKLLHFSKITRTHGVMVEHGRLNWWCIVALNLVQWHVPRSNIRRERWKSSNFVIRFSLNIHIVHTSRWRTITRFLCATYMDC